MFRGYESDALEKLRSILASGLCEDLSPRRSVGVRDGESVHKRGHSERAQLCCEPLDMGLLKIEGPFEGASYVLRMSVH